MIGEKVDFVFLPRLIDMISVDQIGLSLGDPDGKIQ
jgi:hypothetical protein